MRDVLILASVGVTPRDVHRDFTVHIKGNYVVISCEGRDEYLWNQPHLDATRVVISKNQVDYEFEIPKEFRRDVKNLLKYPHVLLSERFINHLGMTIPYIYEVYSLSKPDENWLEVFGWIFFAGAGITLLSYFLGAEITYWEILQIPVLGVAALMSVAAVLSVGRRTKRWLKDFKK